MKNIWNRIFGIKKKDHISPEGHIWLAEIDKKYQQESLENSIWARANISKFKDNPMWYSGKYLRNGLCDSAFQYWLQGVIDSGLEVIHNPKDDSYLIKSINNR